MSTQQLLPGAPAPPQGATPPPKKRRVSYSRAKKQMDAQSNTLKSSAAARLDVAPAQHETSENGSGELIATNERAAGSHVEVASPSATIIGVSSSSEHVDGESLFSTFGGKGIDKSPRFFPKIGSDLSSWDADAISDDFNENEASVFEEFVKTSDKLASRQLEEERAEESDTQYDDDDDGLAQRLEHYKSALQLKSFPLQGNPVGYAWSKAVAKDMLLKEDYDRVGKSREAQRAFRMEWCRKQHDRLQSMVKVKKDTFEKIDESVGEYVSIAMIFKAQGGESTHAIIRKDGLRATVNYVKFCLQNKHFVAWNEATQRCDFLLLRRKWRKLWKESWSLQTVVDIAKREGQQHGTPAIAEVLPSPAGGTPSRKPGGNNSDDIANKEEPPKDDDKRKDDKTRGSRKIELEKTLAQAMKTKKSVQAVLGRHRDVDRLLSSGERWQWNKMAMDRMRDAIEKEIGKSKFLAKWLLVDASSLKKEYPSDLATRLKAVFEFETQFVKPLQVEVESTFHEYQSRAKVTVK